MQWISVSLPPYDESVDEWFYRGLSFNSWFFLVGWGEAGRERKGQEGGGGRGKGGFYVVQCSVVELAIRKSRSPTTTTTTHHHQHSSSKICRAFCFVFSLSPSAVPVPVSVGVVGGDLVDEGSPGSTNDTLSFFSFLFFLFLFPFCFHLFTSYLSFRLPYFDRCKIILFNE